MKICDRRFVAEDLLLLKFVDTKVCKMKFCGYKEMRDAKCVEEVRLRRFADETRGRRNARRRNAMESASGGIGNAVESFHISPLCPSVQVLL